MNERVMQFRIGMFVIVAGLVLTMLIVWFGESPTLFRNYTYLTVYYAEAPGISEGIPVRRSGVRVGEVASLKFDDRADAKDGVLVTLALDRQHTIKAGIIPRLSRALIGDVTIDLLPGPDKAPPLLSETLEQSLFENRIVQGQTSPDPANALAAATTAFERAGSTLIAIETAANGLTKITDSADSIEDFIATWQGTGQKLGSLADEVQTVMVENKTQIGPAIANIREAAQSLNMTLDEPTRENVQAAARNLSIGSEKLGTLLTDLAPLATDLGAPYGAVQKTHAGQLLTRVNKIAYEVGLLSASLADPSGRQLNTNGSIQRLLTSTELYDSLGRTATAVRDVFEAAQPILRNLTTFSERIARDPAVLGRGVLDR